jgi:hypothetical protein
MPTVLRVGPYRLFFYSGDAHEPPHVHVAREDSVAKFWLDPVRLAHSRGFRRAEGAHRRRLVGEHAEELLEARHDYFDD